jgi:predicted RNA-binding protein
MCESAVYLVQGPTKDLVMAEVARMTVAGNAITCFDILGERKTLEGVRIAEANLLKHEIILELVKG